MQNHVPWQGAAELYRKRWAWGFLMGICSRKDGRKGFMGPESLRPGVRWRLAHVQLCMVDREGSSAEASTAFPGAAEVFLTKLKLQGPQRYNSAGQ